jgi:phospholipase C
MKPYFSLLLPLVMANLGGILLGQLGAQTFTVLHTFDPAHDGSGPGGALILSGNTLYGTAAAGGSSGMGTVFALNTNGTGFKILHTFSPPNNNTDGVGPGPGLVISGNVLYGAASGGGGAGGSGTVFAINTDGTGFRTLHSFTALGGDIIPTYPTNSDGANPNGGLVLSGSILYGTTYNAGPGGSGTVFALNTDGTGFRTLYSFSTPNADNIDGVYPNGGLILSGSTLYGTAYGGGSEAAGTIFALNTAGTGFQTLHSFSRLDDGAFPAAGLVLTNNILYGTTPNWGGGNGGTVFALNADGSGFRTLYTFALSPGGTNSGGASPGGLVLFSNLLYGTTYFGGSSGRGTLFELTTYGTSFRSMHSFVIGSDGGNPTGSLLVSSNTLYGTASGGGPAATGGGGTVFDFTWLPDLAVTFLGFDWQSGELVFAYTNQGNLFTTATTAKLFWANGTTTNDIIKNVPPISSVYIPAGFSGPATNRIHESLLSTPPTNATYFLLVLDPDNLITESKKTNNIAFLTNTFRHVVLVMMENRSFDHFLGWLPNSSGKQEGLAYPNTKGQFVSTWNLAPSFQGCLCALPDQIAGARDQYNDGKCDGWLLANKSDNYCIGYYTQADLPFFSAVAPNWTVCDHYYAAVMAETQPNRMYQHSGQTDRLQNRGVSDLLNNKITLPTIWDTLTSSNIAGTYYYSPVPYYGPAGSMLSLYKKDYSYLSTTIDQFYIDCKNGNLPAVSFVDPLFTSVLSGLLLGDTGGNDDHPHSDIRNGEAFLTGIYNAIVSSPQWSSTVLIINFDEWGGFFDHVPPPLAPGGVPDADIAAYAAAGIPPEDPVWGRLGFRVPCLVISPWSRGSHISANTFDHCSVLKMIENRWNLPALTVRDAHANDLANTLALNHPDFDPPTKLKVPSGPVGGDCQTVQIVHNADGTVTLTWDSPCHKVKLQALQSVGTSAGTWYDVTTLTTSPYTFTPDSLSGFYRYRAVP